jgi:hypothetical protein
LFGVDRKARARALLGGKSREQRMHCLDHRRHRRLRRLEREQARLRVAVGSDAMERLSRELFPRAE